MKVTLMILWLALHSWKIVAAEGFSVIVGLATAAAIGLAMVGAFNLLAIAFFVLFVGLGVDFGIQLSVRYRDERHKCHELQTALRRAARGVATLLTLAAAATAVAFFSFLPTPYKGLCELGLIAGCGMSSPSSAALPWCRRSLCRRPGKWRRWASVRSWIITYKAPDSGADRDLPCVVLAGIPALFKASFDFNPVNLQDPHA